MKPVLQASRWRTPVHRPSKQTHLQVLCFPHAGGGASCYRSLPVTEHIQWQAVQLPGRENRLRENPAEDMQAVIPHLVREITSCLEGPLVLYGHSMGAWMAYELACQLQGAHKPVLLVVSGSKAPHRPRRPDWHLLPDQELVERILDLSGTPSEVFHHPELRPMLLRTLRADLKLAETYRCDLRPLDIPLVALAGHQDPHAVPDELIHWGPYTRKEFRSLAFPGDHFFNRSIFEDLPALIHSMLPDFT
ncbi:thioesterase II family protein [Deinococcus cellulosilyticus]|uniref:Thioesterase n=1 Tax=Deinococcus cellulosilyticus (strain DSM 18568 / NBRC 106333 / KACC 11606 / 5516J-15) TaxID=1223518 RepID=A0A511N1Y8_DEIC1|nr:alpha/beta fold hydrolase [Deinococcus cellulosilyticus]GEM46875.1 thioesterase [Deinococcus cellulosilyticus NBRC 106333 = KACC 11606]